MQTTLATVIVLLAAAYLLRIWMPVLRAKNKVQLSGGAGPQRSACGACTSCSTCG